MPKVEWTKDAIEDLRRLDTPITKRVLNKISWFSQHFNTITPEPLSRELVGSFKLRISDWRAVYTIETDVIVIHAIGHRKEVYQR